MVCKVSDFGLSRELEDNPDSEYQTQVVYLNFPQKTAREIHFESYTIAVVLHAPHVDNALLLPHLLNLSSKTLC